MTKTFPTLKSKALLAPMSGYTDPAFRHLCRKYKAGLTYTEFVSSAGLTRKNKRTLEILKKSPLEKPSATQIFGNNIKELAQSAKFLEKKFDIIDINCGCPAIKVIKTKAGSELMKNPNKIAKIIKKLNKEVKNPITIKIRAGIDNKHINALEIAKIAEKAGASAITIHARTQKQGYSGKADWKLIKKIKQQLKIPVIGNGDIATPEQFKQKLEESGVDYIMIGRGAISNPYLFKQINDYMQTGKYDTKDKFKQFREYLVLAKKFDVDFIKIKNHAVGFTRGTRGGARLRKEIMGCKSLGEVEKVMKK